MSTSTIQEKKQDLNSLCMEAEQQEQPVYFTHNGKRYVIVTEDDFQYFEDLEDARLSQLAEKSLQDPGEDIPYETIRKELGLDQ